MFPNYFGMVWYNWCQLGSLKRNWSTRPAMRRTAFSACAAKKVFLTNEMTTIKAALSNESQTRLFDKSILIRPVFSSFQDGKIFLFILFCWIPTPTPANISAIPRHTKATAAASSSKTKTSFVSILPLRCKEVEPVPSQLLWCAFAFLLNAFFEA